MNGIFCTFVMQKEDVLLTQWIHYPVHMGSLWTCRMLMVFETVVENNGKVG